MTPLALSVDQAAELLSVSPWTVRNAVRRGELPSRRLGSRILIPVAELERMFGVTVPDEDSEGTTTA